MGGLEKLIKGIAAGVLITSLSFFGSGCRQIINPLEALGSKEKNQSQAQKLSSIVNRKITNVSFSPDGRYLLFEMPESKTESDIYCYDTNAGSFQKITSFELNSNQAKINIPRRIFMNDEFIVFNHSQDNGNQVNLTSKVFDLTGNLVKEFNEFSVDYSILNLSRNGLAFVESTDNNKRSGIFYDFETGYWQNITDPFLDYKLVHFSDNREAIFEVSNINNSSDKRILLYDAKLINGRKSVIVPGKDTSFKGLIDENRILITATNAANDASIELFDKRTNNVIPKTLVTQIGIIEVEKFNEDLIAFKKTSTTTGKVDHYYIDLISNKQGFLPGSQDMQELKDAVRLQDGTILAAYKDKYGTERVTSQATGWTSAILDVVVAKTIGNILLNKSKTMFAIDYYADSFNQMLVRDLTWNQENFGKYEPIPKPILWYEDKLFFQSGVNQISIFDPAAKQTTDLFAGSDVITNLIVEGDRLIFLLSQYNGVNYSIDEQTLGEYDLGGKTKPKPMQFSDQTLELITVTPDNKLLVFQAEDDYRGETSYWIYNRKTTNPTFKKIGN